MLICGIDEAGRGPLAGPVVACSVIVDKKCIIRNVTDSKLLTEEEREKLFVKILKKCVSYRVGIMSHTIIDKINILQATMAAMDYCLRSLDEKPDKVYVDGNYFKLPFKRQEHYNYETVIGGDEKIFAVSCASIIAKVTRDRIMKELHNVYPQYNFAQHKGYATKEHIANIREHGLCEIHRRSFCGNYMQLEIDFSSPPIDNTIIIEKAMANDKVIAE